MGAFSNKNQRVSINCGFLGLLNGNLYLPYLQGFVFEPSSQKLSILYIFYFDKQSVLYIFFILITSNNDVHYQKDTVGRIPYRRTVVQVVI